MLILDTHAFIWLATDLSQLTGAAKDAIRFHATELYISSISVLEISLMTKCGKLDWGQTPLVMLEQALKHHRVEAVAVSSAIAWESTQLEAIHRDPFDRIIIATALEHKMTILTKDPIIPTYPKVKAVWE